MRKGRNVEERTWKGCVLGGGQRKGKGNEVERVQEVMGMRKKEQGKSVHGEGKQGK